MRTASTIAQRIVVTLDCVLGALVCSACSPSSPQQKSTPTADVALYSEFRPLVAEYVRQKYGWSEDIYRIEFNRWEGAVLAFWVINDEDEKGPHHTGGGKSFEVWVDPTTRQVTKEFYFQ